MEIYKSLKIDIRTVFKNSEMLKFVPDHLKTKKMYFRYIYIYIYIYIIYIYIIYLYIYYIFSNILIYFAYSSISDHITINNYYILLLLRNTKTY